MANIRIDLDSPIVLGQELVFKSPADCSEVSGLRVYYPNNGSSVYQDFQFADAHGNNAGSVDLFAANVLVKVILDTDVSRAYVQNADTNKYLEEKIKVLNSSIEAHKSSNTNPHNITIQQIGAAPSSHVLDKSNPHKVTAEQVGARPNNWMPTASEVGARPNNWTPSASDVGAVPTSRKINGKALSSDVIISASDVGATPNSHLSDKNNPHGVTPEQIGAVNSTNFMSHVDDYNNPHGVYPEQIGALPSYGGELGGDLGFTGSTPIIYLNGNTGNKDRLRIYSGEGKSYDDGASIMLHQKNHVSYPGWFSINTASDGTKTFSLSGKPNGELTWGGKSVALLAYPVGSIYLSVNSTSPASLFGGTWERIKDKFLLSAGNTYTAGTTGGEASHTLTVNEMPSHKHISFSAIDASIPDNYGGSGADYGITAGDDSNRLTDYDRYTGATGGNQPHNNMPPYVVVYVWKRIA